MSKVPKELIKREIVLADGRYLIFYIFAPADQLGSSRPADPIRDADAVKSAEEN